jgi:acyl carrier protein
MTNEELIRWLAAVFEEPPANLTAKTQREQIAGWDSLGMLTLMAELDEQFGIQLTEKDIESLNSVADVLAIINSRAANRPP